LILPVFFSYAIAASRGDDLLSYLKMGTQNIGLTLILFRHPYARCVSIYEPGVTEQNPSVQK